MAPRIDPAALKNQIDIMASDVADLKAAIDKLTSAQAPSADMQAPSADMFDTSIAADPILATMAAGPGASAGGGPLQLTDAQRRICIRVINVYETGTVEGDYGAISIFHDGPNRMRQVTYGRSQTTEYSDLRELVSDYVSANGVFSDSLRPYVARIGTTVGNPPHSPLVDDQTFLSLLRRAGNDPVMRQTQDVFFDRVYLDPALRWGGRNGFTKALSALVIYDSFNHSGGIPAFLRARFPEPTPANSGDEETWIGQYVAVRQDWLATASNPDLHPTVYRTRDLLREINRGDWDLSMTPIFAHGVPVDGAPSQAPQPSEHVASMQQEAFASGQPPGAPLVSDAAPFFATTVSAAAAPASDAGAIDRLVAKLASSPQILRAAQVIAAQRLLAFDGEMFPHDGCAITLSVLMQQAGIAVPDTFPAIQLGQALQRRGWKKIPVGQQQKGDVGSTCGPVAHHGTDHIYLVLRDVNNDEMVIADNQNTSPHFRFASGQGKSPTTFFLRASA